jgi:hypothetical protein
MLDTIWLSRRRLFITYLLTKQNVCANLISVSNKNKNELTVKSESALAFDDSLGNKIVNQGGEIVAHFSPKG